MANEMIQATGAFAVCQAASSTADGALCGGSNTAIGSAIATEDLYPVLDFKVDVSVGTPVAGGTVDVYRRYSDGTDQEPAPAVADFLKGYVGSVMLDNQTGYYYLHGVANPDPADTYYMVNEGGATLTIALEVRGRTTGT